jgi:hypothetical protein
LVLVIPTGREAVLRKQDDGKSHGPQAVEFAQKDFGLLAPEPALQHNLEFWLRCTGYPRPAV